jgi:hypothetical protein
MMYPDAMECIVRICRLRVKYSRLIEDTRKFLAFGLRNSPGALIQAGFFPRRVRTRSRDLGRGLLGKGRRSGRVSMNLYGTIDLETGKTEMIDSLSSAPRQ